MFGKQVVKEPTIEQRTADAENQVNRCTAEIESLYGEYRQKQADWNLVLTSRGTVEHFAVSDPAMAASVHAWVADFKRRLSDAEAKFQRALSAWAGLKGTMSGTN